MKRGTALWQILLLVGMFVLIAVAGGAFAVWRFRVAAKAQREDADRARRKASIATVAPAPLPTDSVLSGSEEVDADGYPRKFVSQVGLRSLLHHGKYAALTTAIEEFQAAFERDPRTEYWIHDAIDAFETSEPELGPKLDAWVAASPSSFAPYLARAAHRVDVGFFERGDKWAKDTPASNFAAMDRSFAEANEDITRALAIHPKLLPAMQLRIRMGKSATLGRDITAATTLCPSCFLVRATYMIALQPRWGGSYDEMDQYATRAPVSQNPRLRFLKGYADIDRAHVATSDKKYDEALAHVERAGALGEFWLFLHERARARLHQKDFDRALADIERADALRPHAPAVLFQRARIHYYRKEWEPAGVDLLEGLRIDPSNSARAELTHVVQGLEYTGDQYARAGRKDDALRVLDLAAELDPANNQLLRRRASVVMGTIGAADAGPGPDLATLEERARAAPDDFRAQQALDLALSKQGKFDRVIEIWTAYIARHPDDAKAYNERGGAYFRLGRKAEAHADATKACDLGLNEGCQHAKQTR